MIDSKHTKKAPTEREEQKPREEKNVTLSQHSRGSSVTSLPSAECAVELNTFYGSEMAKEGEFFLKLGLCVMC